MEDEYYSIEEEHAWSSIFQVSDCPWYLGKQEWWIRNYKTHFINAIKNCSLACPTNYGIAKFKNSKNELYIIHDLKLYNIIIIHLYQQRLHHAARVQAGSQSEGKKPMNITRNRYRDVIPSELPR